MVARKYRTFWRRFGAGWIDFALFLPLIQLDDLVWSDRVPHAFQLVWMAVLGFTEVAYSIFCHARWGQTVGKRLMGVRVVDVSGEPLRFRQAVLRDSVLLLVASVAVVQGLAEEWNLMELSSGAPELSLLDKAFMLWMVAEFVTMLANDRRRAVHDWMAGSVVVRAGG